MAGMPEEKALQSRAVRRLRRFFLRTWQAFLVGGVVLAVLALAVVSPGLVRADVRLDEGTVHVVKQDSGGLGVLNAQINELADYATVGDSKFTLLQDEERVLVHGTGSSTLATYDPVTNRLGLPVTLPNKAKVSLAGGTLLVVEPSNGKAWFGTPEQVLDYDFQERRADLELGDFGTATVTANGEIIGMDIQRSMLVRPGDESVQETPLPFTLERTGELALISSVGAEAVVLDTASGRIWVEGMPKPFEVSGAKGAKLVPHAADALSGGDGAKAIYSTRAGLIALTADGPRSLTGNLDADPITPVQVDGCVYAAFGDQFVKTCPDEDLVTKKITEIPEVENVAEGSTLVFHVNRSTVVLNEVVTGAMWMVDDNMLFISKWDGVIPPDDQTDNISPTTATVVPPDREKPNQPPNAEDDELAARAGRSTILDVLDNDSDPDGDVLTISAPTEVTGATMQTVRGGSGLQITVDSDTTGTLEFTYTISDGREGTDTARVRVRVLDADPAAINDEPYKRARAAPLEMRQGDTVTKRVLVDWRDPDGDSLILVRAWLPPESADEVSYTPEGDITFRDVNTTKGAKTVNLQVSDGHSTVEGEMLIEVNDQVVPPIAHGDFATVSAGRTVTVRPLENDVGFHLALTEVEKPEGCECDVTPDYRDASFSFSAKDPGVYYVTYKVSNGPVAMGLVRIDVRPETTDQPPVAALDVALLPPGGSVTINPLLNDTDLDGDVLVVQSVSSAPGLQVVLERRHLVTISAVHDPEDPVTLTYRVSDGRSSVWGTIVVIPTKSTGSMTPQAVNDDVRIRAGSTQSVDVLDNDSSPSGHDLMLDKLVENPLGDRAWIDRNRLRVSVPAGTQSSSITIVYQLKDIDGRVASATVTVTVVSEDAQNVAPVPPPLEERVLAGTTSRIVINTDGVDVNGDSVRLVGLGSAPQLGRVSTVGDGWLSYEAYANSEGTDVFSYRLVDSLGAVGEGEIRVGVAPALPENSPPVGITDEVLVRPGRHVQVAALRNDVDIDGDAIGYVTEDPVEIDGVDEVEVIENRDISFTAPLEPGVYTGTYWIEDVRGEQGSGQLQVVVDENAPLQPPETRDDVVPVSALEGTDWVEVDVTANDLDPDGRTQDLRVEVPDYGAEEGKGAYASADGRSVTVPVGERMQEIRYDVVDADDQRATGLILVPGRSNAIPVLVDPDMELKVVAGRMVPLDIGELVRGTESRSVKLTSVDFVSATYGRAIPSATRIEYTPDLDHVGAASVVFEVSDVVSDQDTVPATAYISIPVTVLPPPNKSDEKNSKNTGTAYTSPELVAGANPVLRIGPGEGDARLNLTPLFRDADNHEFFFENFAHLEGDKSIEWRKSSDSTTVIANTAIGTQPGTTRTLKAEVVDTAQGRTKFEIRLEVISSTRPLATAVTDIVQARAGQEVTVPVLANDRSNLLEDSTLTLMSDPVIVNGSGGIKKDEDNVVITPSPGFVGTLTARYTIMDGTADPSRRVDGTIQMTVKDRPSRPGAPRDAVVGNGVVTFTYTAGSSNGYPVMSRTATATTAEGRVAKKAQCTSTTCTVTGLTNDEPYRFQVVEANEAGDSDASPQSGVYTPDVKPSAPGLPVVGFGDRSLTVDWRAPTWENPGNPGSPVDRYTVVLLDGAGQQVGSKENLPAGATTLTWDGLTNGKRYRFRVMAGNKAGDSPYSEMSAVEWPAGKPGASGKINATATQNPLGGAFEVAWDAAGVDANGDPVTAFLVTPVTEQGVQSALARTVSASGQATQSVLLEGLGQKAYKFRVEAVNKAGRGAAAVTTQWQTAWELPVVEDFFAVAGDGEIQMGVRTNYEGRFAASPQVQYRLNGGDWRPYPSAGRATGLTNGQAYDISVRVVVGGDRASAPNSLNARTPRSAIPTWSTPETSALAFQGFSQGAAEVYVSLKKPTTLVASGGWDPSNYWFNCGGDVSCNPQGQTRSNDFVVSSKALREGPGDVSVQLGHFDNSATSSVALTLSAPFVGSWNPGSGALNVQLNHVRNAACRVIGDGVDKKVTQTGSTSLTISEVLPRTPDGAGRPPRLDVTCTFGQNLSASLVLGD